MQTNKIKNDAWQNFLSLCKKRKNSKELENFLKFILTPDEKAQITTRISLIKDLLHHKKSQRAIAKDLNISIYKITRGSNALKEITPELKKFLQDNLLKR
jgi:TrpR family trp operon transcriptional repressor